MVIVDLMKEGKAYFKNTVITKMGDPNDISVVVECCGLVFEAWDLTRSGNRFETASWMQIK